MGRQAGNKESCQKTATAVTEQSTLRSTETHTHVNIRTKTKIHINAYQVYRSGTVPQEKEVPLDQHVH